MIKKHHEGFTNKKAFFDYEILDTFEAGLVLEGHEIKSIRLGSVNLKGNFIHFWKDGLYVEAMHIGPYKFATDKVISPMRKRKLLLHKKEIEKILTQCKQKGISTTILEIYFKGPLLKAKIGLVRGKKLHDKRETLKKKDELRQTQQALKHFMKS